MDRRELLQQIDLRKTPDITIEHCSVLLEKIEKAVDRMEAIDGFAKTFCQEIDPYVLKDHYEEFYTPGHFSRLFTDDFGKGVLVGSFVQRLLEKIQIEEQEMLDGES